MHLIRLAVLSLGFIPVCPLASAGQLAPRASAPTSRVVVICVLGRAHRGGAIANLPAKDLSHIFYAFADIARDGSVTLANRCVDVGACGRAHHFPRALAATLASSSASRRAFRISSSPSRWRMGRLRQVLGRRAHRCRAAKVCRVRHRPFHSPLARLFDGIDIDWNSHPGRNEGNVERPPTGKTSRFSWRAARQLDARGERTTATMS